MKPVATNCSLLSRIVFPVTTALLLTAGGCTSDKTGQAAIDLATDLVRQLLAVWLA